MPVSHTTDYYLNVLDKEFQTTFSNYCIGLQHLLRQREAPLNRLNSIRHQPDHPHQLLTAVRDIAAKTCTSIIGLLNFSEKFIADTIPVHRRLARIPGGPCTCVVIVKHQMLLYKAGCTVPTKSSWSGTVYSRMALCSRMEPFSFLCSADLI